MTRVGGAVGVGIALLAVSLAASGCMSNRDEGESNGTAVPASRGRATVSKPIAPPSAVGSVGAPLPEAAPPERGTRGITETFTGPAVPAAVADQAGQAFNLTREEEQDPQLWLPKMAQRSTSVIVGTVVADKTLPIVEGAAVKHLTTVKVLENWVGTLASAVDVTWTETSESHELKLNQTYLLFLITGNNQTWCIDDSGAALTVTNDSVSYRGKSLTLAQAKQHTTAK